MDICKLSGCVVGLTLAFALSSNAFAEPFAPRLPPPGGVTHTGNPAATKSQRVGNTIFAGAVTTISVPANAYTDLDVARSFNCMSASGCVIQVQATAEAYSATGGSLWAICTLFDGSSTTPTPACEYLSILPTSDTTATAVQWIKVSQGTHTVQPTVYFQNNAGTVYTWEATYTLAPE